MREGFWLVSSKFGHGIGPELLLLLLLQIRSEWQLWEVVEGGGTINASLVSTRVK